MGYRNLRQCVNDLIRTKQLTVYDKPVDTYLEIAAVQRRLYERQAPAVLFTNTHSCNRKIAFPMLANLYGTQQRLEYIFRDGIEPLRLAMKIASDLPPKFSLKEMPSLIKSWYYSRYKHTSTLWNPPVLQNRITLDQLPQLVSWQEDGGAYITLPQVYTESPRASGNPVLSSNLGMYRVQISGNEYIPNEECGLHYQIQRGIALHHAEAKRQGHPLAVKVFIGGAPCMTLAAIMPLPENVSEIIFAGILGQHRIPIINNTGHFLFNELFGIYSEADFCITGILTDEEKTEGPFGDHLGYYSLAHKFPVMKSIRVYHRKDAIYPFTVVGHPPQEDTEFGKFIHNITGDVITKKLPGIKAVNAVDEAGVHPLLLAIGRETYPNELHTLAHSILGSGQLALAKYLFITDEPSLDINDIPAFFRYVLERVDWTKDIHFITQTHIDTLDYSAYNYSATAVPVHGSKVFIAAAGSPRRHLADSFQSSNRKIAAAMPGILCVEDSEQVRTLNQQELDGFPLIVLVDNIDKIKSFRDFLWTAFTKSDPATDISGIDEFTENKHWGCRWSLVIDARRKPHHAPELIELPDIARRAEQIADEIIS